VSSE
jgi:hypothetical protein